MVVKKDKSRQRFDKSKILNGVVRACEKRPVPLSVIEQMVDEIETGLNNMMKKEVDSSFIGELVMDKLKDIDEVAYVRFASVYRQFTDINTFISEIETLLEKRKLYLILTSILRVCSGAPQAIQLTTDRKSVV